ncbi:MAG: hypothetical protein ACXAD7_22500 [Candidatus Kariarchaeaceae archaeon]|jgi:hypothetical protein
MARRNRLSKRSRSKAILAKVPLAYDVLRVTPTHNTPSKNPRTDRLTDLLVVLFIFGIAMWFRFYSRAEFLDKYPWGSFFHITIAESDPLDFGQFLGLEPGDHVESEGYVDYSYYYIDYVNAFVDKDWNPYSGNLEEGDVLNGYVYGPLYIYLIAIGKAWFDLSAENSIIYSNLVFDSLSYVMVYLLAKRVTGNVIAMMIAVIGSFSPIALFYASVRVLNAPQMNFFTLLFVYLFLKHRDTLSMATLAVATLTKQFPLFLAMPVGFFMVRRYGLLKGTTFILLYFLFLFLFSLPWIILTPVAYYTKLFLPGGGKDAITCPHGGEATNLVAGTLTCDFSTKEPTLLGLTDFWSDFLFIFVNNHTIFLGSLFLLAWVGFTGYDYMEKNPKLYLRFFAAYLTLSHATIARGIYKYYLSFLMPFILLSFIPGCLNRSPHLRLGALINRGWSKWLQPKYRTKPFSWNYWLYFLLLLGSVFSIFWVIDMGISLFATTRKYHVIWLFLLIPLSIYFMLKPSPVNIKESDDTITISEYRRSDTVMVGFVVVLAFLANYAAEIYFGNNHDDLKKYRFIAFSILLLFLALPYVINTVTKTDKVFNSFNVEYSQLFMDIIGLGLAFYIYYFINREIFLINRYFTTSVVLAFSIFLMGCLGGEIWTSFFLVPYNAFRRFYFLVFVHQS